MNGNSILIDTNIALFLLNGNETVAAILEGSDVHLSFITELELLGYSDITEKERTGIRHFISDCRTTDITDEIKELTVTLRKNYKLKLPDSIIAATAIYLDIPFLSADKAFKKVKELKLALYEEE